MKSLRDYLKPETKDYVILLDDYSKPDKRFIVECLICNHRHDKEYDDFFEACRAFNAAVETLKQ